MFPVVLHTRITSASCELLQRASLVIAGKLAWIEIQGLNGPTYSPELDRADFLTLPQVVPRSAAKSAQSSGFQLKKENGAASDLPAVRVLKPGANCPALDDAIAQASSARIARRAQAQSIHRGPNHNTEMSGFTPASVVNNPSPNPTSPLPPVQGFKNGGTVALLVVIDVDGKVKSARVIRSVSPTLDKEATKAVSGWTFIPAKKDGLAVATEVPIEITFKSP